MIWWPDGLSRCSIRIARCEHDGYGTGGVNEFKATGKQIIDPAWRVVFRGIEQTE
ncbi:MAG: hypothetical protein ACLU4J_06605 [Butyricimonas paravirosa]